MASVTTNGVLIRYAGARRAAAAVAAMLVAVLSSAPASALEEIQTAIPDAKFVPVYSTAQRASAAQRLLRLAAPPALDAPVSLTPNAPYAANGAHLSFWKPSFVIGTPEGGEAGINYWGKYQDGHVNVGFTPDSTAPLILDCRLLSAGAIAYKVFVGGSLDAHGEIPLRAGHFLLAVATAKAGEPTSVELWPTPGTQPVGIFGCDLSVVEKEHA